MKGSLFCLIALFGLTACFDVDERSARKLRVFYSSDVVGSVEPCG